MTGLPPREGPDDEALAAAEAVSVAWCLECGEEFHDDDTGGYNPECRCGAEWCVGICRSCCHALGEKYPPDDDGPIRGLGAAAGDLTP